MLLSEGGRRACKRRVAAECALLSGCVGGFHSPAQGRQEKSLLVGYGGTGRRPCAVHFAFLAFVASHCGQARSRSLPSITLYSASSNILSLRINP